jgi:putative transposase
MKKTRYSEEQIVGVLKEADAGIPVSELCRKYGISDATYYNWKAKYGGMTASDVKRLKQLEDENRRLKQLVADLTLDNQALKAVVTKNF